MGARHSFFTEEQLSEYQDLTYFTQQEIIHCFDRYCQLDPIQEGERRGSDHYLNKKLPQRKLLELPELRVNPFRDRICKVFSQNGDGELTFEDFLDMMSVFSEQAPKHIKIEYAFRIYDFNDDGYLCRKDLTRVINRLCGTNRLPTEGISQVLDCVMSGANVNEDDMLSFCEFQNVIQQTPDFVQSFRIRL